MKLVVQRIPESGGFFDFKLTSAQLQEWLTDRPDLTWFSGAAVGLDLHRVDRLVTLRGEARFDLRFLCSRCGEEYEAALTVPIKMVMAPRRTPVEGDFDEDEGSGFYDGEEIHLDDVVLEQIALSLPNIFLCDAQCKGICLKCKANLNDGPCQCGS